MKYLCKNARLHRCTLEVYYNLEGGIKTSHFTGCSENGLIHASVYVLLLVVNKDHCGIALCNILCIFYRNMIYTARKKHLT